MGKSLSYGAVLLTICSQLAMAALAQAAPKKERCKPNGTENERIGCAYNANVDLSQQLATHYGKKLDEMFAKCARDITGGGSGGHSDRVQCVSKALDAEAKQVNLPRR